MKKRTEVIGNENRAENKDNKMTRKEAIRKSGYLAVSAATMMILLSSPNNAQAASSTTPTSPPPFS